MHSILWIVILIIVYGSLFPFNFQWVEVSQIAWRDWATQLHHRTTNGDILSNFLTFVPLGYFGYVGTRWFDQKLLLKALLVCLWGGVFAFCLQLAQFFLPSRVPTLGDALINLIGVITGVTVAICIKHWLNRSPQVALRWPSKLSIPLTMLVIWLLYQLFPYLPSFTIDNLAKSSQGLWRVPVFIWYEWVFLTAMWFWFFIYLNYSSIKPYRFRSILLLVSGIVIAKLFIAHNHLELTQMLAVFIALLLTYLYPFKGWKVPHLIVFTLVVIFREMYPFNITRESFSFNWIPFHYYLSGSMWVNTQLFLEKLFIYGCLIHLWSEFWQAKNPRQKYRGMFIAGGIILLIELLQLVTRFQMADVTDIIIAGLIGYSFHQFKRVNQT